MSESSKAHKAKAPKILNFAVYVCSTSRYKQIEQGVSEISDVGGDTIVELLKNSGQNVLFKKIIADYKTMISEAVQQALNMLDLDVAVFSGGTGITPTDITIETVTPFFEKTLPGFGEFFRRISFDRVGSAAVLSRAVAGVAKGKALFCIPGSPDAVRVAVEMLILPEAAHIVKHARE
ncbi:MAG: MogA/MoaB family molybdenum cofactor biosynthesis protein [Candidatus Bathyarchaeia archaeon]|jgi:molybdenum cofactor biosynthesis protein B